jgi:hypothetical protein
MGPFRAVGGGGVYGRAYEFALAWAVVMEIIGDLLLPRPEIRFMSRRQGVRFLRSGCRISMEMDSLRSPRGTME